MSDTPTPEQRQEWADLAEEYQQLRAEVNAEMVRCEDPDHDRNDLPWLRFSGLVKQLGHEFPALFAALSTVEAERDANATRLAVLDGSACAEEQAEGNGPCGVCTTCLRAERDRLRDEPSAAERQAIADLFRMGCTCGVITAEDGKAWDALQEIVPAMLARWGVGGSQE